MHIRSFIEKNVFMYRKAQNYEEKIKDLDKNYIFEHSEDIINLYISNNWSLNQIIRYLNAETVKQKINDLVNFYKKHNWSLFSLADYMDESFVNTNFSDILTYYNNRDKKEDLGIFFSKLTPETFKKYFDDIVSYYNNNNLEFYLKNKDIANQFASDILNNINFKDIQSLISFLGLLDNETFGKNINKIIDILRTFPSKSLIYIISNFPNRIIQDFTTQFISLLQERNMNLDSIMVRLNNDKLKEVFNKDILKYYKKNNFPLNAIINRLHKLIDPKLKEDIINYYKDNKWSLPRFSIFVNNYTVSLLPYSFIKTIRRG